MARKTFLINEGIENPRRPQVIFKSSEGRVCPVSRGRRLTAEKADNLLITLTKMVSAAHLFTPAWREAKHRSCQRHAATVGPWAPEGRPFPVPAVTALICPDEHQPHCRFLVNMRWLNELVKGLDPWTQLFSPLFCIDALKHTTQSSLIKPVLRQSPRGAPGWRRWGCMGPLMDVEIT